MFEYQYYSIAYAGSHECMHVVGFGDLLVVDDLVQIGFTSCTPYVVVRILSDGSFPRLRLVLECHVLIYMNVEISFLNSCHIFTQFTLLLKLTHILTLIKELAHCICVVIIPLVNLELDKLLNRQKLTLFW